MEFGKEIVGAATDTIKHVLAPPQHPGLLGIPLAIVFVAKYAAVVAIVYIACNTWVRIAEIEHEHVYVHLAIHILSPPLVIFLWSAWIAHTAKRISGVADMAIMQAIAEIAKKHGLK